jgi:hypothetical protein
MLLWNTVIRQQRTVAVVGHVVTRFENSAANYFHRSFSLSISNNGMPAIEKTKAIMIKDQPAYSSSHSLRNLSSSHPFKTETYSTKQWSELSDLEKKNWACLGWNSSCWLKGPPPESERKTWDKLSDEEKVAARELKISMLIPSNNSLHDPLWAKDSFDGAKHFDGSMKLWHELRPEDQSNWKVLGWKMLSWNLGRIDSCWILNLLAHYLAQHQLPNRTEPAI